VTDSGVPVQACAEPRFDAATLEALMKVPLHAACAWLTILVCGCGAQTLDAGSNTDAGAFVQPPGVRWAQAPTNDLDETCLPGGPTSVVGSWLGHFDNYVFPSGSNEIRIDLIDADPADQPNAPCGKIVFGGGDPPPLPTDPTAFYPPGYAPTTIDLGDDAGSVLSYNPQRTLYEGFRYDFAGYELDSSVDGGHVQLGIMTLQIYKAWCEMQLSYYQSPTTLAPNAYDCVPSHSGSIGGPTEGCKLVSGPSLADATPVSCAQIDLCTACSCQPNGCTLASVTADVHLDIQFQGDAGSGSASIPLDGIQAFTLQRAP
jgi:hypothetical protein